MRTESILYSDFSKGSFDESAQKGGEFGTLATWVTSVHLEIFGEQDKWTRQAVEMIQSKDECVADYIEHYFWGKICHINKASIS